MRGRGLVATLVLATGLMLPSSGLADGLCRMFEDGIGDQGGPASNAGSNDRLPAAPGSDLTGLSIGVEGDALTAEIGLVAAGAAPRGPADAIVVTLRLWSGQTVQAIDAHRRPDGVWDFTARPASEREPARPVDGEVDPSSNVVRLRVAPSTLGIDPSSFAVDVRSIETVGPASGIPMAPGRAALVFDQAPELGVEPYSAGSCRPVLSADGEPCLLALDPYADNDGRGRPGDKRPDPNTDIVALRMWSNAGAVVAEISVAELTLAFDESTIAYTWEIAIPVSADETIAARARMDRRGAVFTAGGHRWLEAIHGSIDAYGRVRLLIPRDHAGLSDGMILHPVARAHRTELPSGARNFADETDSADATGTRRAEITVGASCDEPLLAPVVRDTGGDSGSFLNVTPPQPFVASGPSVALRAAGLVATPDLLAVSVRVESLASPNPAGFDWVGWTVSWFDGTTRWYAQAARGPRGMTYSYGADRADARGGEGYLTGSLAGGVATSGSVEADAGLVSILVPRGGVNATGDDALRGFGATSWVGASGRGSAQSTVVDQTPWGRHIPGEQRPA